MSDMREKRREAQGHLEALRQGKLAAIEIPGILLALGKAEYLEARPDIEHLLSDPDPEIRQNALKVLTVYWHLDAYWEQACSFVEHDPIASCRVEGAFALGVLRRDAGERKTLALLARVVRNEQEVASVRIAAYKAMRSIVHFDPLQERKWMREGFALEKDVNWFFVDACLEQA